MSNLPPEVLIYIQTVRNFFKNNKGTSDYFLSQVDEEMFFKHLGEISKKNFEDTGEVMLNETQFELLRKTLIALKIADLDESVLPDDITFDFTVETIIFIDDRGYEKITTK